MEKKIWDKRIFWYSLNFLAVFVSFGLLPEATKAFTEGDVRFYHQFENNLFDEIASSTVLNEYAASGNITYVAGKYGSYAIKITSTSGSGNFLRAEGAEVTPYVLTNGDPFSYSHWIKGGDLLDYQGLAYAVANINDGVRSNGDIYFAFNTGSADRIYTCTGTNVDDGTWHNLVVTGQIGSLSTTMKIYFDGTLLTSCSWGGSGVDDNVGDETPDQIDFFHVTSAGNISVDDFAGFSKILTQDEIDELQTSSVADALLPDGEVLAITSQDYDQDTKILYMFGTCEKYGSGIGQMDIYLDSPTSTVNTTNIFAWNDVPSFVSCEAFGTSTAGIWATHVNGINLTGTHTIFIDDSFYHPEANPDAVSVEQDFTGQPAPIGIQESLGDVGVTEQASDLACTTTEWEDGNWWVYLKCEGKFLFYSAVLGIANVAKVSAGGFVYVLKTMFPFNLPVNLKSSWEASATSTTPAELSWLFKGDSNQNIELVMPHSAGGATSSVVIWGPTFAANTTPDAYDFIKAISPYIMALLFFTGIWRLGKNVYEDTKTT